MDVVRHGRLLGLVHQVLVSTKDGYLYIFMETDHYKPIQLLNHISHALPSLRSSTWPITDFEQDLRPEQSFPWRH